MRMRQTPKKLRLVHLCRLTDAPALLLNHAGDNVNSSNMVIELHTEAIDPTIARRELAAMRWVSPLLALLIPTSRSGLDQRADGKSSD